ADVIANLAGAPVLGSANFLGSAPVGATGVSVAADYHHVVLGTSGADTLIGGGSGQDVMVGGVGADRFAFTADHVPWTPSRILDFTRGADKIDIAAPLAKVGYTGSDPFATGHLRQEEAPGIGTRLIFDSDGPGQQDVWGQFFLVLDDVTAGSLTGADLIITGAPPPPPPPTGGDEIHARFANDTLVGGSGADTLFGSQGSDLMTGGGGADVFRWENEPWSPATVTDFHLGEDRIDLSVLFQKAGFSGADPIAAHYISLLQQDGDTLILFDRDADATAQQWPNYIIKLDDFQEANLTWAQLAGSGSPPPPPPPGQDLWSQHPDDTLTGGAGNDTLHASRGQDLLTGGGGDDIFAWAEEAWAPAVITDFDPGNDKLDFRALFDQAGYYGATPFQDGYLSVIGDGADGTKVLYDRDAAGSGQQWPNYILHIEHVAPGAISSSDFLVQ
ncbi:MAG TPA: M10 family metallopeptidase C-terminal domain-containing protein, partial [Phenylobacterium sp.]